MKKQTPHFADPPKKTERTQEEIAREALAMKKEAAKPTPHFEERTPGEGMRADPHEDQAPSGALDHAGHLPAMQRSKFAR